MRYGSSTLADTLKGSFNHRYVADVFNNGVRVLANVPCTNVSLTDADTSLVQGTGLLTVIYQDNFAASVAPTQIGDLFSPFGTEVRVYSLITNGPGFSERIAMGVYLVAETPAIITTRFLWQGGVLSKGDRIDLTLKDRFYGVQRDRFQVPGSPPSLTSVWAEVQRLTGLTITKTITDGPITAAVAYQEDKLQAVYDLATVLDATACTLSDGTVSMRTNAWPDPVATVSSQLVEGDGGTLVDVSRGMANDLVYNQVVVRASDTSSGAGVLASAEITSGPLRTANSDGSLSPYRRVPYFYSSPMITTTAQAQAYADLTLPRMSKLRSVKVTLTEVFNPLRELGDVLTVNRRGETFTGRVTGITRTAAATQTTTVMVG